MSREEAMQFLTDTGISPEHIMELVEALSSSEKPEQKMGRWITQDTVLGKCCVCSECGGCPNIEYRYCPYCGAKMEGEE